MKRIILANLNGHKLSFLLKLSPDEAKTVKFLEDSVKKTLKKLLLKATRKGKALSEEVP